MNLANISLAWMIEQLREIVHFDAESICEITTESTKSLKALLEGSNGRSRSSRISSISQEKSTYPLLIAEHPTRALYQLWCNQSLKLCGIDSKATATAEEVDLNT